MTTAVPNAEYTFGAHEAAVVNAEAQKSAVRKSASGGALPRVCTFIAVAPLFMDLTGAAAHFSSAPGIQGRSACSRITSRPEDPPGLSATTTPVARTALSGNLGKYLTTVVQPDDRPTVKSWPAAIAGHTPSVPGYWDFITPGPDDRSSSVWRGGRAPVATTGILGSFTSQGPQPFDLLSIQPVIEAPTFNPQGNLMPVQDAAPEVPWPLGSQTFPTLRGSPPPSAQPLRLQSAGPQIPWDLPALFVPVSPNRQGPTVRGFVSAPEIRELYLPSYVWPPSVVASFSGTLTGVSATGSVGTVIANSVIALTGVSATGSVGTVIPFAGTLIPLTGVSAIGSVGSVSLIKVLVPYVETLPLGVASVNLNNATLQVGTLTYQNSSTVPLGNVIHQAPVAGTVVFEDSAVNLQISSGYVSPINTPSGGIKLPNLPNKILPPDTTLVDQRGVLKPNWWRFLLNVSNQAMGTNQTVPATVTVGASPFVFTTPAQGTLLVSGGPVTLIEYSKDGATWYPTGVTQGQIQMVPNDHVRITYMNAPALTFFPR